MREVPSGWTGKTERCGRERPCLSENPNNAVIHVNQQLAEGYDQLDLERLAIEREKEMEEKMLETSMPGP